MSTPTRAPGPAPYVSPLPIRPVGPGSAIASEWVRVRSVSSTRWTLGAVLLLTVGIAMLIAVPGSSASVPPTLPGYVGILVGQIGAIVFGTLVITSEYTHGTIRSTLIARPRRGEILFAKVVVTAGLVFPVVAVAVGAALAFTLWDQGSNADPVPAGARWWAVVGTAGYITLLALVALALGCLLRGSAGTVTLMIALVLVPTLAAPFLGLSDAMTEVSILIVEYSVPAVLLRISHTHMHGGAEHHLLFMGCLAAVALVLARLRLARSVSTGVRCGSAERRGPVGPGRPSTRRASAGGPPTRRTAARPPRGGRPARSPGRSRDSGSASRRRHR
ncbi:ABC transporter permease subunit [Streptomyces sp. ST2-7A]|uniref:ABC transporter permease subunit n=1 Tax=Streptomyces sp. ST2-7A TaxID=2907214 RepID=UPI0027E2FBC5|nr:ABC transporter permease subunit [Streptomyces sp. ST2-7A]